MESSTTFQAYTTLMLLIVLGLFSEITAATCDLAVDSPHASAVHAPAPSNYPQYSCTPCEDLEPDEVHILNIYQPTGTVRRFKENPQDVETVKVNILANSTVRLELLLISYEAAHWLIDKPEVVTISQVIMMSGYNNYSSVKLTDKGYLNVEKRIRPFSYDKNKAIIDYAKTNMGGVTSYSAVYETLQWWLTVGDCSRSQEVDAPLNRATPDLSDCEKDFWQKPCWAEYDFVYESHVNECKGKKYVTEFRLDRIYYIGASLCTTYRYSLFMATSLQDTFLGMVDMNGKGEDHCQVLGVDWSSRVKTDPITGHYQRHVYYRKHWGEAFKKRKTVFGLAPQWYECGKTIPDSMVFRFITTTTAATTTAATITSFNTTPSSPSQFNWLACLSIIGTLLLAAAVIIAVVRCCSRKKTPEPDLYDMGIQRQAVPPAPSQRVHLAPSAPPAAPPTQDTSLLSPPPSYLGAVGDEAPPAYDDVMRYPLAKTTITAPPYS